MNQDRKLGRSASLVIALAIAGFQGATARADEPPRTVPPDHAAKMTQGLALFKEHVRPALVKHCLDCHGGKATKGDFDLSDRKPLIDSGAIDGGGKASRLYALITHAEEPHMPAKAAKLPEALIEKIVAWIDLGAPYDKPLVEQKAAVARNDAIDVSAPEFWAFRPLRLVAPPAVKDATWPRTTIDRFILAKQEDKGLIPNPIADRRVLIRRLTFDLIGLPPTPEEVDAFLADTRDNAYEALVDRLLDSPHYGERWARHWLDVTRFAESHGYEQDYDRKFAFYYRDFLIRALNRDMPYDQLIRWQLAGDELAPDDPWALTATGFIGGGAFPTQLTEAEFESARYDELDDMTATTGSAFLGLSVGCARCHDHKYDPIRTDDYYRLAANFTTTIRSEIDLVMEPGAKPTKVQVTSEGFPHTKHHADDRGFPHFYPKTYHLNRGDVNQKKAEAEPGFLRALMRNGKDASAWKASPPAGWTRTSYRRTGLANWITDTDNGAGHLAARVAVNRLWQHHFGRGIVATPNDFGLQGERPTHPELLDWLAVDLIHHGWTLKRLHKQIVTSAVYMQDSQFDEPRAKIDRENLLLWRHTPRRLEAEAIRDAMLLAADRLDPTMFGPGSLDPNMKRRSVYFFIKRSQLVPTMMLFDWPEHLVSIGQRAVTTTAPQALMFMNSPLGRSTAEGLAARLASTGEPTDGMLRRAYRIAFGREPTDDELKIGGAFLETQSSTYRRDARPDPDRLARIDFCQALMSMSEFIYIP